MAANSSSSIFNDQNCSDSLGSKITPIASIASRLFLVLPFSAWVSYLGLQRWQQQRSFATTSHCDIITYHSAAVELMHILGVVITICGSLLCILQVELFGFFLCSVAPNAVTLFNVLTCVERYLAVVHPVVYLGLRQSGGVRIRNVCIGCVWMFCLGCNYWIFLLDNSQFVFYICFAAVSLAVVSFCSLSVLCVLIRPGPGELSQDRAWVDQSKMRAFYTIITILAMLLLCFLGYFVCSAVVRSNLLTETEQNLGLMFAYLCSLPSSVVLPVLYLQRAGKLSVSISVSKNNDSI